MTGAVLPPDCDTIVPIEEVTLTESTALVRGQPTPVNVVPGKF
jgi:molybdopterin biosynthesis enzyme